MKYSVDDLYLLALAAGQEVVQSRVILVAWLIAIAMFIIVFSLAKCFGIRKLFRIPLAIVVAALAFGVMTFNLPQREYEISHQLANVAITKGVDEARKFQATEEQYILAPIVQVGIESIQCRVTVDYLGECQSLTNYFTHREINVRYVREEHCSRDPDGEESCYTTTRREWDDEYTPWFTHIVMYWIVPNTKAKYLDPRVYLSMVAIDPNARPKVDLHSDWRAPEDARDHVWPGEWPGEYNNRVPEIWRRANYSTQTGGPVVVATFLGKYFNWGSAAESTEFQVYEGHYRELKTLTDLPGPSGATFKVTDALGQDLLLHTTLSSVDGDLPLDYNPVQFIGFKPNETLAKELNQKALEFQGDFGPHKEAIAKWFLVSDSIVSKMGGLNNVTQALKAYLNDKTIWGKFKLPKNQVILVASISDDGTRITGRDMETGMPYGNILVKQKMEMSIASGESLPLNSENLFGNFSSRYIGAKDGEFTYQFSDLSQAGSAIGLLYEETPNWAAPDPNSDECSTAPAEHLGFVRYQMCTQQYRESTIQINKDGALLIVESVRNGAAEQTPVWYGWVILVLSLGLLGFVLFRSLDSQSSRFSYYRLFKKGNKK